MRKITFSLCFVLTLFSSCTILKANKLAKGGSVQQEQFSTEIPFEMRMGLIIVKVEIAGNEYNFLLDTGAPNVLSTELAEKLELSNLSGTNATDSQGNQSSLKMVSLDTIAIGNLNFLNTAAIISPFNLSKELSCLKIDGLIGSNLMRNAIWKIDFQRNVITITDELNSLNLPAPDAKISFEVDRIGLPYTDVEVNNTTVKNVLFDSGSNGHFNLSNKAIEDLLIENPSMHKINSFGSSTSGAFGSGTNDSTLFVKIPEFSMGDVILENLIVRESNTSLVGMEFFKQHTVVFDWSAKELIIINQEAYSNSDFFSFGFTCRKSDENLVVSALFENSSASEASMQLGDQLLNIDGASYETFSDEDYCEFLKNNPLTEKQEIKITIKRNDKILTFLLRKKNLFE